MSLSKFPDILLPVILHFGNDISNRRHCIEVPLVCHCRFSHLYSRQSLVSVDILDNFLNLLKLFLAVVSDPMKSLPGTITKNWQGLARKMNSELATPILVAGG